jgi:hypothetical protein
LVLGCPLLFILSSALAEGLTVVFLPMLKGRMFLC